MRKAISNVLVLRKILIVVTLSISTIQLNAQASIPGYTLSNFVNNVVQRPQSHLHADASFITNNPNLNTSWWNLGDLSGPPTVLLLTWNNPIFNGTGNDIMIVCLNSTLSGKANVRLLLTDDTYTNTLNINFTTQMLNSPNVVAIKAYQTGESAVINGGYWRPAGKPVDIASFYTGPLAVKGIEFNNYETQNLDLIAVASTQNAILPITLSAFTGNLVDNTPMLFWQTESEIDASHFEIERSIDGISFTKIATINAITDGRRNASYQYLDNTASNGNRYYYRIKMVDLEGTFKRSSVININRQTAGLSDFVIMQSPGSQNVILMSDKIGQQYHLISANGTVVAKGIVTNTKTMIPTISLPSGMYFLQLNNGKKAMKISIVH